MSAIALWRRDLRLEWAAATIAVAAGLVLAAPPLGLVLAGLVFIAIAFVTMVRPAFGIGALLLTIPIQTSVTLAVSERHLSFTRISLAAIAAGWFVWMATSGDRPKFTIVSAAFASYLCALLASVWNASNQEAWAAEIYRWSTAALVYVIAASVIQRRSDLLPVLAATGLSVVACAGSAVWQVTHRLGPTSFTVNGVTRAFGAFGEPNPFAGYFEIAALPMAGIAATLLLSPLRKRHIPLIIFSTFTALAGLIGVYLTHSRGGAIGTAAGLLAMALVIDRRVRTAIFGFVGVAALSLTLTGATGRVVGRVDALGHSWNTPVLVTSVNFSVEERIAHWGAAVRMWEAHPIVGVGAGNFNDRFRTYTPEWRFRIPRGHAHNGYLQAAAQAGSLGLIGYLSILAAALYAASKGLARRADPLGRAVAAGSIGATVAVMTHGLFDYLHVLNLGLQLSVVWAIAGYAQRRADEQGVMLGVR